MQRGPTEVGVQENAGGVDQRGICRHSGTVQGREDLADQTLARIGVLVSGDLSLGEPPTELVDGRAAGVHHHGSAEPIGRVAECWKVEQTMNRRDVSIGIFHGQYSNPVAPTTRERGRLWS